VKKFVGDFTQNMPDIERSKLKEELKRINISDFKLINMIKESNVEPLKYVMASKRTQLHNYIELPPVMVLNNVPTTRTKDVTKILSSIFDLNYASTKYTRGYLNEFVESLEDFSSNSLNSFKKDHSLSILHFDNASEFFSDLNKTENRHHKIKFDNLLSKNTENRIIYVLDDKSAKYLNSNCLLELNFDDKIHSFDLSDDLDEHLYQLGTKISKKASKLNDELSEITTPDPGSYIFIRNLMLNNPVENILYIEGADKQLVDKITLLISSKTDNMVEKVDCTTCIDNLLQVLQKKSVQSEELYNRTGKRTFLLLENIETLVQNTDSNSTDLKALKEFIKNSEKQQHTIFVINPSDENSALNSLISSEHSVFKLKLSLLGERHADFMKSFNLMMNNMAKNDFSHIDKERFENEFLRFIALERAGLCKPESITNGIMIYGPDNATKITLEAIKNTVDANIEKITYNPKKPSDLLDQMYEKAEKAEKIFQKTGRRTILEIEKLDEFLSSNDIL